MPKAKHPTSKRQLRWAFASGQPFAHKWGKRVKGKKYQSLPEAKAIVDQCTKALDVLAELQIKAKGGMSDKERRAMFAKLERKPTIGFLESRNRKINKQRNKLYTRLERINKRAKAEDTTAEQRTTLRGQMRRETERLTRLNKQQDTLRDKARSLSDQATKALDFLTMLETKAGARHSRSDLADMQTLHDIAVKQGATCAPMEGKADPNFGAKLGETIAGNLVRGAGGQFAAAGAEGKPKVQTGKPLAKVQPKKPEPKPTTDPKKQQQAKQAAVEELGLYEDGEAALTELVTTGSTADDGGLAKMGLAEEDGKGGYRLSARGKQLQAAIADGDPDTVREVVDAAREDVSGKKIAPAFAVKSLGGNQIGGYACIWGNPQAHDLSIMRDFFTPQSELWLDRYGLFDGSGRVPMLYDHAQHPDDEIKSNPAIGKWTAARTDDIGVFVTGELDTAHKYAEAIKELVTKGVLRLSIDSAQHLVVREPQPNGANWLKRFPALAISCTTHPAEPRLLPLEAVKALGIDISADTRDEAEASPARPADLRERVAALMHLYRIGDT